MRRKPPREIAVEGRYSWAFDGRVFDIDFVLVRCAEWDSRAESSDPNWNARELPNGLTLAMRFVPGPRS
jgi:hypothetical protein